MLEYQGTKARVDAVAMGACFYACWDRARPSCQDPQAVPRLLSEAMSLDDVFAAIDNSADPYGIASLKGQISAQGMVRSLVIGDGG